MKILAIETSSLIASAAVVDEDRIISEYILNHKKTHSQKIMPLIEEVLSIGEMQIEHVDVFAVASGPGSFTGLRIGVSTIKALAQVANKPVVGIPTLDGLAYNLAWSGGIICPILDARREQVYTSIYRWTDNGIDRLTDYMALPVVELIDVLKGYNERVVFNGDGVVPYRSIINEKMGDTAVFAPVTVMLQRASSIGCLALLEAQKGEMTNPYELKPFYLRQSQAEQKRKNSINIGDTCNG